MEFIFDNLYDASGFWLYFCTMIRKYGSVSKADLYDHYPSLFATIAEQRNYAWNDYGWMSTDDISIDRKEYWTFVYRGTMPIHIEKRIYTITLTEPRRLEL